MIGVPAKHKTLDLLQFTASCHSGKRQTLAAGIRQLKTLPCTH